MPRRGNDREACILHGDWIRFEDTGQSSVSRRGSGGRAPTRTQLGATIDPFSLQRDDFPGPGGERPCSGKVNWTIHRRNLFRLFKFGVCHACHAVSGSLLWFEPAAVLGQRRCWHAMPWWWAGCPADAGSVLRGYNEEENGAPAGVAFPQDSPPAASARARGSTCSLAQFDEAPETCLVERKPGAGLQRRISQRVGWPSPATAAGAEDGYDSWSRAARFATAASGTCSAGWSPSEPRPRAREWS